MTVSDGRDYAAADDSTLVLWAREDKTAFGMLYERYAKKVYNYVYYRTGNHHDAEDLTARTWQRAMLHIQNYVERGLPFQAWLYRIAHNLVANWHRDQNRRKVIPLDDFVASRLRAEAPEHAAEEEDEQRRLVEAFQRLPEERQQLIVLKFVDKLSNQEIGQIMERTEGAIKSLYHRTLLALREELLRQETSDQAEALRRAKEEQRR
ncbi:MAG: sigma-70 family RNA polymerase sigma factor [Anaerolinea sp.]|nr:sigma-70 family RNA polymerase sigma factor [Anaerolinea sp.]MCC6974991.1 sigma-70 family RNA polymerase sigma factor [Anaerolineae bacterium]CAG0968877.1 ECF RNA polymerase sigma factor SigW [Anaerolineae bacterium]